MSDHVDGLSLKPTMLAVNGMTCAGCARTVERVLSRVPGVRNATVDFDLGAAVVNGSASPAEMIAAIEKAGYSSSLADAVATRGGQG